MFLSGNSRSGSLLLTLGGGVVLELTDGSRVLRDGGLQRPLDREGQLRGGEVRAEDEVVVLELREHQAYGESVVTDLGHGNLISHISLV